ncbi:MAG: rRNA maturation RNase YbeY, partial [Lentisphaeria bacterium]|nr:rRNA maturation RNase YbeY [Lentisphaeria bacterium]
MKNLITSWKNSKLPPPDPAALEHFARRAVQLAGLPDFDWNFEIEFSDDDLMIRRNRELLGHEGTTDVFTFPYLSGDEDDLLLENEVAVDAVVNLDAALREGRRRKNSSYSREAALYIVHALLHSAGLDDLTPEDRRRMRRRERSVMKKLAEEDILP